jgi:phytoene dehydrogenase-like protein
MINISDDVEMVDISTPATIQRYTGNWQGSIQGWANENLFEMKKVEKELPNLKNFFMIGHWVQPGGGVPMAFLSGRTLVQILCKRTKMKFQTQS